MKLKLLLAFSFCLIYNVIIGQISQGGYPVSKSRFETYTKVPIIDMPDFDKLAIENDKNSLLKSQAFAQSFDVNINPGNAGIWSNLDNQKSIWQVGVRSSEAYSLILNFYPFKLPENAELFIFNENYSVILGAYTSGNNSNTKNLAIEPIPGDIAYIELIIPTKNKNNFELTLNRVSHDYLDFFNILNKTQLKPQLKSSGTCNIDINCETDDNILKVKNATFLYIYYHTYEKRQKYCNGTLINNTRQNLHPYFITAGHCLWDETTANSVVAYFDYESYYCNGPLKPKTKTISGSDFVATVNKLDFCLAEFNKLPPISYKPYMAGWSRLAFIPENVFCIHHPLGDAKKVAFDYDSVIIASFSNEYDKNSFWEILRWDKGTTEGGSSGAPLYDTNYRLIGTLTGGEASCNLPVEDYFTRFAFAWNKYSDKNEQLAYWLDPDNTMVSVLNGIDPYYNISDNCKEISNVSGLTDTIYYFTNDWGSWTGYNTDSITEYAQKFENDSLKILRGIYVNFAKIHSTISNSIKIKIWADNNNMPGITLVEKNINFNSLLPEFNNYIEFDTLIYITSDIFVGYQLNYPAGSTTDTLEIYQTKTVLKPELNYFVKQLNVWTRIDEYTSNKINSSLNITIKICDTIDQGIKPKQQTNEITYKLIPNPAKDYIIIDFGEKELQKNSQIQLYDITGKQLQIKLLPYAYNKYRINLYQLNTGLYFINVISDNNSKSAKFIIQ